MDLGIFRTASVAEMSKSSFLKHFLIWTNEFKQFLISSWTCIMHLNRMILRLKCVLNLFHLSKALAVQQCVTHGHLVWQLHIVPPLVNRLESVRALWNRSYLMMNKNNHEYLSALSMWDQVHCQVLQSNYIWFIKRTCTNTIHAQKHYCMNYAFFIQNCVLPTPRRG